VAVGCGVGITDRTCRVGVGWGVGVGAGVTVGGGVGIATGVTVGMGVGAAAGVAVGNGVGNTTGVAVGTASTMARARWSISRLISSSEGPQADINNVSDTIPTPTAPATGLSNSLLSDILRRAC
jgi:hypothetical protein